MVLRFTLIYFAARPVRVDNDQLCVVIMLSGVVVGPCTCILYFVQWLKCNVTTWWKRVEFSLKAV